MTCFVRQRRNGMASGAAAAWVFALALSLAEFVLPAGVTADEPPASKDPQAAGNKDPQAAAKDIRQGQLNFNGFCSRCHGMNATGAKGPNLTTGRFRHGSGDEAILANIKNGIRGTGMPGFPFEDDFLLPIVSFLRAGQQPAAQAAVPGNLERGRELFAAHKCNSCHWTGSAGGRRGPDLTRWRGEDAFFHRKVNDPDQDADPRYQRVALRLTDGRMLAGIRLYEDSYNLLLIDDQEVLRAISMREVEELVRPEQSLMPRLPERLSDQDLRDLAEYVKSLAEEPKK